MSFRVFNSIDMVVIIDTSTWKVEKFEKGGMWYHYNNINPPILYTIFQRSPERPLVLHAPYTEFLTEDGDAFIDDAALQSYLDFVFRDSSANELRGLSKSAFGELTVETMAPVVQMTAVYGLTPKARTVTIGSGTAGASGNLFFASTGSSTNSIAALFTERQLHYRAGQGALARGTAMFSTPKIGSGQNWGLATAADALYFGYNSSAVFGIIRRFDGHVIIQKLTITTPATGGENATVTINGTPYTVPLTSGSAVHNTNEITNSLNAQVPVWVFSQNNGFVIARSLLSDPATGSFTLSSATAEGTFAEVSDGVVPSEEFIPQTSWSIDKMDGSGESGMTLDPQKGNVYQISFQYLGFGNLHFFIENSLLGTFQEVHQMSYANNNITPSVSNPTFRINWGVDNTTNDTDITLQGASCAAFIEGDIVHTEAGHSVRITKNIGTGVSTNILTIRNRTVFGSNVNLSQVIPQLITAFTDTSKGAVISICKGTVLNPITLGGTPNFQYHDELNSIVEIDTDGTTVTGGDQVHSLIAGQSAEVDLRDFDELLLSGETLTIAAIIISGSAADVTVTNNWGEDL